MKRVAVLGAGFVSKPAIDYFLERCGYQVVVTSLEKQEAEKLTAGRQGATALAWSAGQDEVLDRVVREADLVLSMIPPHLHVEVARVCLLHGKNMVTTSYVSPGMEALDEQCRERGITILNEIGEDPGLDNMITSRMIDKVRSDSGKVVAVTSYGAGLPAFEDNNNPFGYKFSWSPRGVITAAKSPAAYIEKGTRVEVEAKDLFSHHRLVDLDGIGTFETYPNRDAGKYLDCFNLEPGVSLYRGLLRFTGWCSTMKCFAALDLFNDNEIKNFSSMSYEEFVAAQIGADGDGPLREQVARYLQLDVSSDFMNKLKWLGLLSEEKIRIEKGTNADLLTEAMERRLSYGPSERDMVIIYAEILAEFPSYREKRVSSLLLKGESNGDSAMSRSVSLPAAIAARHIVEKRITSKGVLRPTAEAIYNPVLAEMERFGYRFSVSNCRME